MKYRNNAQFFKSLILWVAGLAFAGVMFAQLSIPTNIKNALITIQEINLTANGQDVSDGKNGRPYNPAIISLKANPLS